MTFSTNFIAAGSKLHHTLEMEIKAFRFENLASNVTPLCHHLPRRRKEDDLRQRETSELLEAMGPFLDDENFFWGGGGDSNTIHPVGKQQHLTQL